MDKQKKVFDNDRFTMWTIDVPKGKKRDDIIKEQKLSPICEFDEDNIPYLIAVLIAAPFLWPIDTFKFFVMHKLSTDEYFAKFVTQYVLNDDDSEGTMPRKKVVEMQLKSGCDLREATFGFINSLKDSKLTLGVPTITDFTNCKTIEEAMDVMGVPKGKI